MTLILHLFLGTLLVWRPWWGLGCRRAALWLELAIFVSLDLIPHLQEEPSCAPACLALLPGPVPSRQVSVHTLTSLSRVSAPLSDAVTISSLDSQPRELRVNPETTGWVS